MSRPTRAGDFLKDILRQAGTNVERTKLKRAMQTVLSEDVVDHCAILGFRSGRLTIEVDSAPLYAELSNFRREELRVGMNQTMDDIKIAQIVFRMGGTGHA